MTILLLCRGDERAKDLLRNTMIAHYGANPAGFDSFQLTTQGRVRRTVGPFTIWLSLDLQVQFASPSQIRQDYQLKFLKIPILNQSEAFDGQTYYRKDSRHPPRVTTESAYVTAIQRCIWAYSALLLMPLSEIFVELEYINRTCLNAHNTQTGMSAQICLYDNYQLRQIIATSDQHDDTFHIHVSQELHEKHGIKWFEHITVGWNDQSAYELWGTEVEFADGFEARVFQLT